MKKILVSVLAIVFFVCGATMTACAPKSSTAVTIDELIREDFAAEKEAEDDAKGREHIEIPEGAEEIEIEGETWHVIRNITDFKRKIYSNGEEGLTGSFILANDIDVERFQPRKSIYFQGRLNGNNYKFYGTKENGGFGGCLFCRMKNAVVENLVFSASDGFFGGVDYSDSSLAKLDVFIAYVAQDSIVRNCINYFQPKNIVESLGGIQSYGGMINGASNCIIENCVNYADLKTSGGIVNKAANCQIINCINYGNLSSKYESGGIVGQVQYDCVIEGCTNYGNIVGRSNTGGILGSVFLSLSSSHLSEGIYTENQIIKGCKNYGDIYVLKEKDTDRLEHLSDENYLDLYCIGGIAGAAAKVENCVNEGNFYGFESFGKGIYVDYSGGIVGIAKEVVDCTTKYTIPVPKSRAKNVGEICGILLGD